MTKKEIKIIKDAINILIAYQRICMSVQYARALHNLQYLLKKKEAVGKK